MDHKMEQIGEIVLDLIQSGEPQTVRIEVDGKIYKIIYSINEETGKWQILIKERK
jgi:hypothetical protein